MTMLRARDVARLLGVRIETVYRYARQRRIPAVRVGGTWRFPEDRLNAWLKNGGRRVLPGVSHDADPGKDPILRVIGIGADGSLAREVDRAL